MEGRELRMCRLIRLFLYSEGGVNGGEEKNLRIDLPLYPESFSRELVLLLRLPSSLPVEKMPDISGSLKLFTPAPNAFPHIVPDLLT